VSDHITFIEFKEKDLTLLREAIEECRIVKDDYEVALIRKANEISAGAHHAVMRAVKQAKSESELEAVFLHYCISRGAPNQAYHPIVASGTNAATLHYQQNNAPLQDRQLLLLDAGCAYTAYASDITRTFPLTGTFSSPSLKIYNLVHTMQSHCISAIKPNASWEALHIFAHQILIKGLLEIGILKGGDMEEILKKRTSVAFFPHGLGHYLGLDTHDVGGKPNYDDEDAMFRYLRIRGRIPVRSVVTVEPGVSFSAFLPFCFYFPVL
jgi:Xaa-Pro dipeptidase